MVSKLYTKEQKKIPSYVAIYDKLYADIMNGTYAEGTNLPSESSLAKEYKVSRHTVRQALTILNEDGLIRKQQGKGSIVSKEKKHFNPKENDLFNPMIEYALEEIETISVNYNFAPPTEVACNKLHIGPSDILLASNNIYKTSKTVGHSFMQIPLKYLQELAVDLNDKDAVSDILNHQVFKLANHANAVVKFVYAEAHVTQFLEVKEGTPLLYIEEVLYNVSDAPIARCKFYFLPDAYEINLWI